MSVIKNLPTEKPKPDGITAEVYWTVKDIKTLNKILSKVIGEHIRKSVHHDEVSFIPEMQGGSINLIRHTNSNHMVICLAVEKVCAKNPTSIHSKSWREEGQRA